MEFAFKIVQVHIIKTLKNTHVQNANKVAHNARSKATTVKLVGSKTLSIITSSLLRPNVSKHAQLSISSFQITLVKSVRTVNTVTGINFLGDQVKRLAIFLVQVDVCNVSEV